MFTQFMGRGIRKAGRNDPVVMKLISHVGFRQRDNVDSYELVPDDEQAYQFEE